MKKCRKCGAYSPIALIREEQLCGKCIGERESFRAEYLGRERRIRGRNLSGMWRRRDDRPRLGRI